jgi:predicted alpha/beta superfamily hydrolase
VRNRNWSVVWVLLTVACGSGGGRVSDAGPEEAAQQDLMAPADLLAPRLDVLGDGTRAIDDLAEDESMATPDAGTVDLSRHDETSQELPPAVSEASLAGFDAVLEEGTWGALQEYLSLYDGPVCEDGTCLVVTFVEGATEVAIRGEFNGWGESPMTPLSFADGYFYFLLEGYVFTGCAEYRLFTVEGWFGDPLNQYFQFSDVALNSAICKPGSSRLALVPDLYSPQLDNHRNLYVYVPATAFDDPSKTFPVIYMQDGFNVFDNPMAPFGSWNVDLSLDALIEAGDVPPVIVVGIDTDDRINEYHYADFMLDGGDEFIFVEPKIDLYAQFLLNTVKPRIDSEFPTRPGREDTCMAGSSFGGISSMYLAWMHPDVFGMVASFSGSYWVGEAFGTEGHLAMRDIIASTTLTPEHMQLKVYLDSGGSDGSDGDPNAYLDDARVYTDWTRNTLISLGWSNRPEWDTDDVLATPPDDLSVDTHPKDVPTLIWAVDPPPEYPNWNIYLRPEASLLHLVGLGHEHNEAAWEARFPASVRYLLNE